AVIPAEGRREIAAIAERHGAVVVEDGTLDELDFGTRPPPPIAAFSRGGRVLTIGSLSKLIWGGLRVGWLRAPAPLLDAAAEIKVMSDLGNSPLSQTLGARLMRRLPQIRERRRAEVVERFEVLAGELSRRLPDWEWERPLGGLSVWVRLPRGDAEEFGAVARRHGVAILPGSVFSPSNAHADHLRMPFCLEPAEIRDGVRRLARAWSEYVPAAARRQERPLHVVV
ncbi:MAG TPA: aminotransferase class I/II-fold pyridoxal phosphate-dependent enzyme, partial [Thermoanaerobaculia bacterium]|nr:aminotransferase class I/II-fold pyridoxal phosphate-dependent enzyme [Thermoanaerobaculia bacterium]